MPDGAADSSPAAVAGSPVLTGDSGPAPELCPDVRDALLTALAGQDRRVLAPWRALVLQCRATLTLPASSRRWTALPATEADLAPLLRQMSARGQIRPLPHDEGLYQVTVPYADRVPF